MRKEDKPWKIFSKLSRFYLSLVVAFSGLIGFIFYKHIFNLKAILTFIGIFFLASAASALNQYQERDIDFLMLRTKNRPIPSKQITLSLALIIVFFLGFFGFFILLLGTTLIPTLLGVFNIIWYNAVYTPLKRKTKYAIYFGALCGSIPPIMGWTAAGGSLVNNKIFLLALFMYMWQIPHVLLLNLKYNNEYKLAGIPLILADFDINKYKIVIFIWLIGTVIFSILFPIYHIFSNLLLIVLLLSLNSIIVVYFYYNLVFIKKNFNIKYAVHSIHIYQLMLFVLLIIQTLL